MSKTKLQALKGFRDMLPEDMRVLNYIFDTWRTCCINFGYEEYNGPPLEYAEIYAKSGDEIGTTGKELYKFKDNADRLVALRPEMTPSVARIVAENQGKLKFPIKWFSIAQFFRAEKPQRGRGREFFQLNADIFGEKGLVADLESLSLAIAIMRAFGADEKMFQVKINDRKFADDYFENILGLDTSESKDRLLKIIDKSPKESRAWLDKELNGMKTKSGFVKNVKSYLNLKIEDLTRFQSISSGAKNLIELFKLLDKTNQSKYVAFDPAMARGFDYYTGVVFEVFDRNPVNRRSLFGGGRYDNLLSMFGVSTPATGFAPGDITTRDFLEIWSLIPKFERQTKCLVSVFSDELLPNSLSLVSKLREKGVASEISLTSETLSKQFRYANQKSIPFVVVIGPDEVEQNKVVLKDMNSNSQESLAIDELIQKLSK